MAPTAGAGPQRHRVVHKECCPHLCLTHPMPAQGSREAQANQCPDTPRLPTRQGHGVSRIQATDPPQL